MAQHPKTMLAITLYIALQIICFPFLVAIRLVGYFVKYLHSSETAVVSLPRKIKWTASSILEMEKSRFKEGNMDGNKFWQGKTQWSAKTGIQGDFEWWQNHENTSLQIELIRCTS